jgi:AcrR family transcriptional regulator
MKGGMAYMTREMDIDAHKIMQMEPEKRDRIINAALAVFRHGYEHTSTDDIVREAGISKGLLYHYFGTKEGLYDFLVSYALDLMGREYYSLLNHGQRDVLELLRQSLLLKMDLSYKYPALFDFMGSAYAEGDFTKLFRSTQADMVGKLYANADLSLFREDVDAQKAISVIQWSLTGYSNSHMCKDKSIADYQAQYETYLKEIDEYFDLFRKIFYKEEPS